MKLRIFAFCLLILFMGGACAACEGSTDIRASYISEITQSGSDNYGVKITYADDKRLEGKSIDTQIKFSRKGEVVIWEEGKGKFSYTIEDNDTWYSMTTILASAQGKSGQEDFEEKDNAAAKTYMFNSDQSQEITLRVVAGDVEENGSGTGEILVGSEPISAQFTLKIKK